MTVRIVRLGADRFSDEGLRIGTVYAVVSVTYFLGG